jgi:hypothetical protein
MRGVGGKTVSDRVFVGSYDVLPWQDIPLWNKSVGSRWYPRKMVVEPPQPQPITSLGDMPESIHLREHVLEGHMFRWGSAYAELYWKAGDERVFGALALFWLASRFFERILRLAKMPEAQT